MRHSTQLVMGLLLVLAAGCSYPGRWQREEMIKPGNLPRQQQARIGSGESRANAAKFALMTILFGFAPLGH